MRELLTVNLGFTIELDTEPNIKFIDKSDLMLKYLADVVFEVYEDAKTRISWLFRIICINHLFVLFG